MIKTIDELENVMYDEDEIETDVEEAVEIELGKNYKLLADIGDN